MIRAKKEYRMMRSPHGKKASVQLAGIFYGIAAAQKCCIRELASVEFAETRWPL
jgi:hypothetical protein